MTETAITFIVAGRREETATRSRIDAPAPTFGGTLKAAVRLGATRAGAASHALAAIPGEDIVVLHLANGPTLVLHPETARDLLRAQAGFSRGAGDLPGPVEVPSQLRWQGLEQAAVATRGSTRGWLGEVLLTGFEIITGAGRDEVTAATASALVARIDAQVVDGVYPLRADGLTRLKGRPVTPTPLGADGKPCLVFVHGTFSETSGTFGKLWTQHPARVRALFAHYGDRVFALDHRTLGASPIDNALTLVRACANGARLHLVTHSRGGLVAEVLARAGALGTLTSTDLADFASPALVGQQQALRDLVVEMARRDIRVTRTVRVACPARGTLLASRRFDAFLSVFSWALELAHVPVLPELVEFLAGVARHRLDPARLPGVAAMVPDSALIRWLHAADAPVAGDLRVIAGDLAADSLGSWIKTLMSDAFYWTDHDLVVQTSSMYGGVPRMADAGFVFDRGGEVSHFNYFANERTVDALVAGLTQERPEAFRAIGPLSHAGESASGLRAAARAARAGDTPSAERPAVFVLPGILGSNLKVDGRRVWLGWRLVNGLKRLAYPDPAATRVEPDGAIELSYDDLMDFLGDTHEVIEFAYDWRRPIEEEALRLARAVDAALDARRTSGAPVRLLAHSMGGIVARTLQLQAPATWTRLMAHPGARLLMLGTPNGGSWAPMQVLSGDDTFGNALTAFGAPFQTRAARTLMAQFPGFLQLQANLLEPSTGLHLAATWARLAEADWAALREHVWWHRDPLQQDPYLWGLPGQPVLDQAVALRRCLDAQVRDALPAFAHKLLLVVGQADFTPDGYEVGPEGLVYLNAPAAGDGRVTLASALLPGVRTWQLDCAHGTLPDARSAFEAYLELLQTGTTARLTPLPTTRAALPGAAAAHVRSRPARQLLPAQVPEGARALLRSGVAAQPVVGAAAPQPLRVGVRNGDLKFVREPLLIGHYRTATLSGTERVVNGLIGGTMQQSLAMGQYPDAPGTHQLFVNCAVNRDNPLQMPRPEAVVVVGLGEEGKLQAGDLRYSVKLGVLALAQRLVEDASETPVEFELAATLLGSGGVGISAAQAAQLIAHGVRDADLAIHEMNARGADSAPLRHWPRVGRLHLVELYLERATEAWRALRVQAAGVDGGFRIDPLIRRDDSALERPLDGGYRGADYDLITAVTEAGGGNDRRILYTIDTRRARTEVRAQSTQVKLVRELVAAASSDQNRDPQIGRTLFQLLVPLELEPFLGSSSEMLLELDRGTAGIPWEMLDTTREERARGAGDERPWAIRTRLLRKLRTETFRGQVIDATTAARILVIGEPLCTDPRYPPLPGARAEAGAVVHLLRDSGLLEPDHVHALVAGADGASAGPDARAVINALMAHDWRVVHIAGHGEPPAWTEAARTTATADGDPRGVVLSNGTYLGPHEIGSMRVVPELVFVNCCHLAARDARDLLQPAAPSFDRAAFAAGVADELIRIGVRCVIAAGWAVDDGPALTFATRFYAALLDGQRFIEAVGVAREAARADGGNTWAAYQCYGDPNWTLRRAAETRRGGPTPAAEFDGIASAPALCNALETLVVQSRFQHATPTAQRERLQHLEARFGTIWGTLGVIADAFGQAWQTIGESARAIEWYARAVHATDGSAPLRTSERLASLRVRAAWATVDAAFAEVTAAASRSARATATRKLKAVMHEARMALATEYDGLTQLLAMHASPARYSLRGAASKRLAMIERSAGRARAEAVALARMSDDYGAAERALRAAGDETAIFYPMMNRLAAEVVRHAGARQWPGFDAVEVDALARQLRDRARTEPEFWCVVGLTELRLLKALAARRLADEGEALQQEFADLQRRVAAPSDWASVADQLAFVLPAYLARVTGAREQAAATALRAQIAGYLAD